MRIRLTILAFLLALAAALLPASASAQCAMCAQGTSQASQESQRAIKRGVLLLLIPPVGIMAAFIGLAVRNGRKKDGEQ
jgi:hypothetical protein